VPAAAGAGNDQGVAVLESENRPWGSWHILDENDGYKVKRIHVNPHQRLSYQTHEHRAEHWVVVKGTATCTIDDAEVVIATGGSTLIPVGGKHRIANAHDVELVIVEVQLGSYTGEDDIVRIEDDYGRDA
jgi:mannose-6-phosphate isomerase